MISPTSSQSPALNDPLALGSDQKPVNMTSLQIEVNNAYEKALKDLETKKHNRSLMLANLNPSLKKDFTDLLKELELTTQKLTSYKEPKLAVQIQDLKLVKKNLESATEEAELITCLSEIKLELLLANAVITGQVNKQKHAEMENEENEIPKGIVTEDKKVTFIDSPQFSTSKKIELAHQKLFLPISPPNTHRYEKVPSPLYQPHPGLEALGIQGQLTFSTETDDGSITNCCSTLFSCLRDFFS